MTLPLPANWITGNSFTATAENNVEAAVNALGAGTLPIPKNVLVSSATTLTLTTTYNGYVFSGSSATTWTLPAVSGNTGSFLILENRGSAAITVVPAGTDHIWFLSSLTSFTIAAGGSLLVLNDGTYWNTLSLDLAHNSVGVLPVANGGTGVGSLSAAPAASSIAEWDANLNLSANTFLPLQTSTAASASTITMTIASAKVQIITGTSTNQTIKLPTTSVNAGYEYIIVNQTTSATVTVQASGGTTVIALTNGEVGVFTADVNTPTTNAQWSGTVWVNGVVAGFGATSMSLSASGTNYVYSFPAISGDTLVTLTATQTLTNKTLTSPTINGLAYTETVQAVGTVGTTATIPALSGGTIITATLTAGDTCAFTMPTATSGQSFILQVKQASTPTGNATFTGVVWPGSVAPTITKTASYFDLLTFVCIGGTWFGSYAQGYS